MNIIALDYIVLVVYLIYVVSKLLHTNTSKEKNKEHMQVPHQLD
jgi:uncharacterized protein YoxC